MVPKTTSLVPKRTKLVPKRTNLVPKPTNSFFKKIGFYIPFTLGAENGKKYINGKVP
jgi:hypothetical protein